MTKTLKKAGVLLVAVVLTGIAYSCRADGDISYELHLWSKHFVPGEYNEDNYGVGIKWKSSYSCGISEDGTDRVSLITGTYRNSFEVQSTYAGFLCSLTPNVGVGTVAISGYKGHAEPMLGSLILVPILNVYLMPNLPGTSVRPSISIVPATNGNGAIGVTSLLSVEWTP